MLKEVIAYFLLSFVSLFTIINPFSTASVFHTISAGSSVPDKRWMARRATITAAVVLIIFALVGKYILGFFSITLEAFQIAGGLLIFNVGYGMVTKGKEHFSSKKEEKHAIKKEDVSIIPLAIPMMSGPGAMTTAIVLMEQAKSAVMIVPIMLAIISVCIISFLLLINAHAIDQYFGETGIRVTDKILGLIVLVIGVQFVINGILGIWI